MNCLNHILQSHCVICMTLHKNENFSVYNNNFFLFFCRHFSTIMLTQQNINVWHWQCLLCFTIFQFSLTQPIKGTKRCDKNCLFWLGFASKTWFEAIFPHCHRDGERHQPSKKCFIIQTKDCFSVFSGENVFLKLNSTLFFPCTSYPVWVQNSHFSTTKNWVKNTSSGVNRNGRLKSWFFFNLRSSPGNNYCQKIYGVASNSPAAT